ncbi:hypothetical protein ACFYM5_38855 [Streptomyces sp. NPDC006706]|uniref:hypothetical protein n=1 Tax=Streptomyces sp. NPDC006706 TaxID=3364761 RepID=UPI0036C6F41A
MSAEVGDGTGLISHSVGGKSCDTVVALDLANGQARWTTDVHSAVQYDEHLPTPGKLAIAGQTAVVQEQGRWRGVNLAEKASRNRVWGWVCAGQAWGGGG